MKNRMHTRSMAAVAALALVAGAGSAARADFNFTDFSSTAGLTMVGSATQTGSTILLTPAERAMSGATWYTAAKQDVSLGFEASMTIRVPVRNGGGADGFALVIQNDSPTALGGNGGGLGYASNPVYGQAGIANSFAVEIDMWDNTGGWADMSSSHISLQSRGLLQNSPDQAYSLGAVNCPDMSDGGYHTIRVVYTPGLINVYTDASSAPVLQALVDLSSLLSLDTNGGTTPGRAWIGVSASTGAYIDGQAQELTAFRFTTPSVPAPGSAALAAAGLILAARRKRKA